MPDRPNVLTTPPRYDESDPAGFRAGEMLVGAENLGRAAGGRELNVRGFELPPGETLCPYHYEYVEEWLLLLDGELDLRTLAGVERLAAGSLVCFPTGPEGGHRVTTPPDAERPARFVMFSSAAEPAVCVYPDSGKAEVFLPGRQMLIRHTTAENLDYFDGEE